MVGDDVEEFALRRLLGQGPERAGLVVPARRPVPVHDAVEPQRRFLGQHVAVPEEVHADDRRHERHVAALGLRQRVLRRHVEDLLRHAFQVGGQVLRLGGELGGFAGESVVHRGS